MTLVEIWFGEMTHGEFSVNGDSEPMVIVHDVRKKKIMYPEDVDIYMESEGHDSYLIPEEFKGRIVFSQDFLKEFA